MKIFALLLLAGLAAARSNSQWQWETGKEYVFDYSGRILTGLPELDSQHFSGLAINCSVHLHLNNDQYTLFIRNPRYTKVDERLQRSDDDVESSENWRKLRIPESRKQISDELIKVLQEPIYFTMAGGEIQNARVAKEDPVWSVNFKKALVLQLQTKFDSQLEGNRLAPRSEDDETYWKVKEEALDGVCEATYQIRELPTYLITENPDLVPYPEVCSGDKYFGLTKTRDVAKCEKRSSFIYFKPGSYGSQVSGNQLDMWSRSSSTRYIACVSGEGKLVLQTIINEAELVQDLLGFKVEKFVTGTQQIWRLRKVLDTQTEVVPPRDIFTLKSMMYEYLPGFLQHGQLTQRNSLNQEERVRLIQEGQIPKNVQNQKQAAQRALPRNFLSGLSQDEELNREEIKKEVKRLIVEVSKEVVENDVNVHEKQVTMKVLSAARGIGLLPADRTSEELRSIYSELKSEFQSSEQEWNSAKSIFYDVVLMSGTPQSIKFLKEKIENDELTKSQMTSVFIWMPQYVLLPTKELLKELFELVTSDKVRQSPIVSNAAMMSFSTLIQRACISPDRTSSYPVNVFGEFCSPTSEIVTEKWIPYLVRELKESQASQSRRNEVIVALGLMSHKSIISELVPFVEGSVEGSTKSNRIMALYSLAFIAYEYREITLPVFTSVLCNPAESTEMRIGAFDILMRSNPPMNVLHRIATLTWTDSNQEVLKAINIALASLSYASSQEESADGTSTVAQKASLVYPLIKKTPGVLPSSASIFFSQRMRELGIGYDAKINWIASNGYFLPENFYTELNYFMEQLRFIPVMGGYRLENVKTFIDELKQILHWPKQEQQANEDSNTWNNEDSETDNLKQQLHKEWVKVIDELGLKERKTGPMSGSFFLRLFETTPMYFNFEGVTAKMIRDKIMSIINHPSQVQDKLCKKFPMNYQRTVDLAPTEILVASDMGFPISIEVHMPVAMSINGYFEVVCNPLHPTVNLKAKTVYTSQLVGWIGTVNPFDNEYVLTGVDQQTVINVPTDVSASFSVLSSKLNINMNTNPTRSDKPISLGHFHVRPFTVSKKVVDLTPMTLHDSIKYIKSRQEVRKVESSFGDRYGLDFRTVMKTESSYTDLKSIIEVLRLYNYNPVNMFLFSKTSPALSETGKASLRKHEFSLTLNPSSSSTKEIQVEFKFGFGKKVQDEQQQRNNFQDERQQGGIKYQTIQVKNQQQQENNRRVQSPYQIQTLDIDQEQVHPRRQQKIRNLLENLNVESGSAFTVSCSTTLKGSRARTWSYDLSAVFGQDNEKHARQGLVKQKWKIHLESDNSRQICVNGELDLPVLPVWNIEHIRSSLIDFRYLNTIGFGSQSCSESNIRISGNAKVSHDQKEFSRNSEEAKKCQELMDKDADDAKFSNACERTRQQAQTVDEVDFKIDYNNVPEQVRRFESRLVQWIKVALWPFLKSDKVSSVHERSESTVCRIRFRRETPTFDLDIERPEEKVSFVRVRLPFPLDTIFPLKAGQNNAVLAGRQIIGNSVAPICKVESTTLMTFDNRSLPFHIDYCFHLLSADCSAQRSFAVFTRTMKPGNRRELKVFLGDLMIVMTPSERHHSPTFDHIQVAIENEDTSIPAGTWFPITYKGKEYGSLFRSADNVIQVKAPAYSIEFFYNGNDIKILGSQDLKNQLCGLCGNFDKMNRERLTGPGKCVYSKPELQVASYRVSNGLGCQSNLPRQIQNQLEREREQCVQYKEIPTKITKSLRAQAGPCTILKHAVVQQNNQVCFSVQRLPQCNLGCKASEDNLANKETKFVCLPEGRLAELYSQKANRGQELPELRVMTVTFEGKVEVPRKCTPVNQTQRNNNL